MATSITNYLNNHTFQYWLNENFDCDEIQDQLDSIAGDEVYPEAFIQWCYDALAFDQEHTVYPVPLETAIASVEEEEEIDHEFHFMEAPLHDDDYLNSAV